MLGRDVPPFSQIVGFASGKTVAGITATEIRFLDSSYIAIYDQQRFRGVAQVARVLAWGARGRKFKSCHSDHERWLRHVSRQSGLLSLRETSFMSRRDTYWSIYLTTYTIRLLGY